MQESVQPEHQMSRFPTGIWQEIARAHPEMTSRWGKAMAGGREAIDRLTQEVEAEHEAEEMPDPKTLAFEVTAQFVVENGAIQAWVRETDNLGLQVMVLLDLATPTEAAEVGALEYRLAERDESLLERLLEKEMERAAGDAAVPAPAACALLVDGAHLREGLKRFRAMRSARKLDRVHFAFDGSFLSVDAPNCGFSARATGQWPGTASCAASVIKALAKVPPTGNEISLRYADGHKKVGTLSVAAKWTPTSGELMATPTAPDWVEVLNLRFRMERARLLPSAARLRSRLPTRSRTR